MTTTTTSGVQPPFFLSPIMTSARGSHAGLSKKRRKNFASFFFALKTDSPINI